MQYKLIAFRYDGNPSVVEGIYNQKLSIQIGTIDDKMNQWFTHVATIPMQEEIGTLSNVEGEIQRQALEYVSVNFNS